MSESRDWNDCTIGEISKLSGGSAFKVEFQGNTTGEIPFIKVSDFNLSENEKYITRANNWVTAETIKEMGARVFPAGSVVFPKVGAALLSNRRRILSRPTALDNNLMAAIPNGCRSDYLHLALCQIDFSRFVQDGAVPSVNQEQVASVELSFPPLPEQKKIAEILSGIDNLIKCEQEKLKKIQTLYESITTRTDQFGFATDSGGFAMCHDKIPSNWKLLPYGEVLQSDMEGFNLCESEEYSPVIVRRRHSGIETRETKKGQDILVKQQFKAKHGCFLISKRQAIHGSTGIVPATLARNPIISKEYGQYSSADENLLDINFMSFYSRTMLFHESVRISVYGVDIEKYVFKDSTWLKQKMLIPPLEEQREIIRLCKSLEDAIATHYSRIQRAGQIKSSLSSDLLSGRKRVSV